MKGLLLKDYYMTRKYCRSFFFIIFIFIAVSVFADGNFFFTLYPIVFASMIPVTLLAYDERSKWNIYSETLPYSRAQIVSVKYLMALILISGVWIFSFAAMILKCTTTYTAFTKELIFSGLALHATGLLCVSILLPVIFKFGSEKGRLVYFVIIIGTCVIGATAMNLSNELNFSLPDKIPAFLFPLAALLIFALSWGLSIKIYQKKEL
ncbi:MAG: ABC-2 transporter permease [Bariatricus sp.]|nr:ABC-2 transporter permease [Bariatricus sp.]